MEWQLVGNWWHGPNGERVRAIAGGDGGGGGGQPQVVQNTGDPQLARLNEYTTNQIIDTAGQFGDLPGLLRPQPYQFTDYGQPNGPEAGALNRLSDFYNRDPLDPYAAYGITRMQQASDPNSMTIAARDIFNNITAPAIRNNATVSGYGRSGAVGEQLTNAGVQMALPIAQESNARGMEFGRNLQMIGQLLNAREQGNLSGLYSLAARPRLEQAGAESAGRNDLLSMLARFPVSSGAGGSTTTGLPGMPDNSGQMAMQAVGSLMSIAMMAAMMACHVAYALWFESDVARYVCASYEVNFEPHGWFVRQAVKLYKRVGPRLAKSRLALTILRPVFERIARRGARKLGVTL